jgi:flagellar operon protein
MVQPVNFDPSALKPLEQVQAQAQRQAIQQQALQAAETSKPFDSVFKTAVDRGLGVKFSAHAKERLQSRNIELSDNDLSRIQNAVDKAASKGARSSLLVMDKAALIVSVTNRTVITAVDNANLKENVFTNIDSAVIV